MLSLDKNELDFGCKDLENVQASDGSETRAVELLKHLLAKLEAQTCPDEEQLAFSEEASKVAPNRKEMIQSYVDYHKNIIGALKTEITKMAK